ncbi:flagellar hook protein FlgE [Modestobacter sp. Leaf380]|uniref:flagellar hook protein FlgE n=1 Tax=Modestobacter sp. Leaf380 TaxID=1736356 RepID=UPI0006FDF867|nr:flagellar hook protein FlgE [Modestobacter sp. Leaf380]KQS68393.1 flagellar hook protein [Modestobacter sp. Leaf380]
MLRSMFSAISGLRAHQTKMDTVANNIANVNTVGFKTQNTVFETTLTQVLRSGKSPDGLEGGSNPAQVGLGVKLAAITTDFGQGKTQNTGRALDFMIQGDGFFVTEADGQQLYTRAGSFTFDGSGKLITADGARVQGWAADASGVVNTNGALGDLAIQYGAALPPNASTSATLSRNVQYVAGTTGNSVSTVATLYDEAGTAQRMVLTYTQAATSAGANSDWTLTVANEKTPNTPIVSTTVSFPGGQNPTFGAVTNGTSSGSAADSVLTVAMPWGDVDFDMSQVTAFAAGTPVATTKQDGYGSGSLQSFSLLEDGTITGVYTNGERRSVGKLALATFDNPSGLVNMGNTSYSKGDNSGVALIGTAGNGSLGTLTSGALEMSNVDLSEEFTGLIIAQRGFQANSRVITASDELLQDLVNLKR